MSTEDEVAQLRAEVAKRDAELATLRRELDGARGGATLRGDDAASASPEDAGARHATEPAALDGESTPSGATNAGSSVPNAGAAAAATTETERAALHELAALKQQVESMKAMLPILTIPNFTYSLVPSSAEGGGKEVAIYEIVVNYGENVYAVYRRYSEFRALHERLEQEFKDKGEHLPRFPGRQGLFRSTNNDSKAISRRKRELQTYIRQLIASDEVRNSQHMRNFFAQLALDPTGGDGYEASIPHTASDDDY